MGMDIHGVGNKKAYFRASIWSWAPILKIIGEVASDFIPAEDLVKMSFNSGFGLDTEGSLKLASRINLWLERNCDGRSLSKEDPLCASANSFMDAFASLNASFVNSVVNDTSFKVDDDHLKEFVRFLGECKGFEIW